MRELLNWLDRSILIGPYNKPHPCFQAIGRRVDKFEKSRTMFRAQAWTAHLEFKMS